MTADEYNQQQIAAGKYTPPMQAVAASAGGVPALQRFYGLTPDGKVGPNTQKILSALVSSLTPIPWGRSGMTNTYGLFSYTEGTGGRINIDPAWTTANIRVYTLHTGRIVKMHKLAGAEFVDLFRVACSASGYSPASVQTFVPRHTLWDPSKSLSLHSWGIAVDFDPSKNPMGGKNSLLRTSKGQIFVQVFRDAGWSWGGDWKMKDDMHFQRAYP